MKKWYLTSIFYSFAALNSVMSAQAEAAALSSCAEFNYTPRLNMTTSYGKLKYNYEYNQEALTRMGQAYGLIESNMVASGLSIFGIDWSVQLNTNVRVSKDSSICIIPASLDVFIGFQEPTIYIDKELNKNSCQYKLVLRHEHQHQQISIAALEYFIPRIKNQIIQNMVKVAPQTVNSLSQVDKTTTEMNNKYIEIIRPMVENFKLTMLNAQKKLDNTENYQYESTICSPHKVNIEASN